MSAAFIVRRGISKTCNSVNMLGNGQWCCQTDHCNHGIKITSTNLLFMALITVAFIKFF